MSKTEIPSIRFRGFDDAWEQRKLGDQMYIKARIGWQALTKNEYMESGDYYLVTGTDIDESSHTVDLLRCHYVTKERYDADNKIQLKEGDIIVTKDGTIGKVAMITGLDKPATLNSHLFVLRDLSGKLDNYYLLTILTSPIFEKFVVGTKTGSTLTGLPQKTMVTFEFTAPNIQEQQKIAGYFRNLDNLITLHQRKFEKLTNVKKSMLKKMFPQNGSSYPEIRFKGFTDPWEQRKLGELVDRVVRKNTNNESTLPLTISAQYGLVDQITYFNNRVASRNVSNYYLVLNGEFAYNKSTSDGYPFGAVKRLDLYEKGVLSTLYIVFAPKKEQQIDSDYLTVFFDTDRWHKGVAERAAEGARNHGLLNISAEDFFDIDLSVPKDIVEQKQIGAFIRQLDNLITLHQRELEKLQSIKKALLEKMFV